MCLLFCMFRQILRKSVKKSLFLSFIFFKHLNLWCKSITLRTTVSPFTIWQPATPYKIFHKWKCFWEGHSHLIFNHMITDLHKINYTPLHTINKLWLTANCWTYSLCRKWLKQVPKHWLVGLISILNNYYHPYKGN